MILTPSKKFSLPGLSLPANVRGLPRTRKRWGKRVYDNNNDAMIPALWAKYTLAILESNMVAAQLFFRDFDTMLADFGDTVNTRKPATFRSYQKLDSDTIALQNAQVTNIPVVLNQHPHVSFIIKDGEESKAMESLVELYLEPAVIALAEMIDAELLGQYASFLGGGIGDTSLGTSGGGQAGLLGGITSSNYQALLTELGEKMDANKCPADGRTIVVGPSIKRSILQNATLVQANTRGDLGTALRTANIGTIYNFDHFMCQNMGQVGAVDIASSTFVTTAAASVGDTTLALGTGAGVIATGSWFKFLGKVYQVQTHAETAGSTTSITLLPALFDSAPVGTGLIVYTSAWLVNQPVVGAGGKPGSTGYGKGWNKAISIKTGTTFPKVGEFIDFVVGGKNITYTIIGVDLGPDPLTATTSNIYLNRPLATDIADSEVINSGPSGNYGFAFHRNAVALVCRPLKLPKSGAGALAGSMTHNGLSMRVVIAYSPKDQGHIVTIDCLMGIKTLDPNYGAVLNA